MKTCLLLFLITLFSNTYAQPVIDWQGCYGSFDFDEASAIAATPDGGTITAGYALGNDGDVSGMHLQFGEDFFDGWIVKTSSSGDIIWQKCYGGSMYEKFNAITPVQGNGYIACGESASMNDGDVTGHHGSAIYDAWVIKIDEDGNLQWQKSLGGSDYEYAYDAQVTEDGGYIISCTSASEDGDVPFHYGSYLYTDIWMVKLDSLGNIEWSNVIGGSKGDVAFKVKVLKDAHYLIAGSSSSNNFDVTDHHGPNYVSDAWLAELDSAGNVIWSHSYGGAYYSEGIVDIAYANDGGYMLLGCEVNNVDSLLAGFHGQTDYMAIKVDASGAEVWTKYYGSSLADVAYSMEKLPDDNYLLCGHTSWHNGDVTDTLHGIQDYWILKINDDGAILWNETFGGSMADQCFGSALLTDSSIALCGYTASEDGDVTGLHGTFYFDYWVVKLIPECILPAAGFTFSNIEGAFNFNGDSLDVTEWYWDFGDGTTSAEENPYHVYTDTGTYIVCLVVSNACGSDSLCKAVSYTLSDTTVNSAHDALYGNSFIVYPNPVTGNDLYLHADIPGICDIIIFDISGRIVWESKHTWVDSENAFKLPDMNSGIYSMTIQMQNTCITRQVVIK